MRAGSEHTLRLLDAADAAAHAAGESSTHLTHERRVLATSARRVEVNQLHTRERRELLDPRLGVRHFDGELLALNQLDDMAILQIDGGDEHEPNLEPRTGTENREPRTGN